MISIIAVCDRFSSPTRAASFVGNWVVDKPRLKRPAPITSAKIEHVAVPVSRSPSSTFCTRRGLRSTAISEKKAPIAAASVGVATPR